jgi:transcriptional regulator with GAF, ATPase, and Fis domain
MERRLPDLDLTHDLRALVTLAIDDGLDDLVRRGLDWLARLAPYDLATVFALDGSRLVVRAARGRLADHRVRGHEVSLDAFPTIREALETRRARAYTEDDHANGDGDPFDGVLDLPPGHACMVVPLCAADRCFGVLTLDRERCEVFPAQVVDLVEVYAQMLALALLNAEQRALIARLHHQEADRARILETELNGDDEGVLESSRSPLVVAIAQRARQVARTETPVLVLGETGTGKERLARAIHAWSARAQRPFVKLNCAAIPGGLMESELFGHVKGSFTGATRDRSGRFQTANGGTLLLDEIGELSLDLQAKLLRVLQEGAFEPVGSDRTVRVDVRIIAATHVDLERAVAMGRFRADLYYRLNVFPLRLPALRERMEDLGPLSEALLAEQSTRTGRRGRALTEAALAKLRGYPWPGNIRELANVLERATILGDGAVLDADTIDLPNARPTLAPTAPTPTGRGARSMQEVEREHIREVLTQTRGRLYGKDGAAAILGLKPSTLQSRMKKLHIERLDVAAKGLSERPS